jgi:fatty acid desaturase
MSKPRHHSFASVLKISALIILTVTGVMLALSQNIAATIFGIFLIGAMFAHAVEIQHQCLHFSLFHSRRINKIVGTILGLPTLTSFHAYRRSHLEHHRNLGTSNDTPFFTYRFAVKPSIGVLLYDLFGISHIKASLSAIFGAGDSRLIRLPEGEEPSNISERLDYGLMGFMLVCATFTAMVVGPTVILKIWILPLLLVAQPLHFLIELPEHIGCDEGTIDVLRNTRTIVGTSFSRWFTNYNNMHVEHHLEPTLSMDQMPAVYAQIAGQHKFLSQTYWQFYKSILGSLKAQATVSLTARHTGRIA